MLKKFLSGVFVLIFLLSFSAFIFSFSLSSVALDPGFYAASFERHGIYTLVRDGLAEHSGVPGLAFVAKDAIFPKSWVKESIDGVVSELLSYLKSERESFEGKISLVPVKSNILSLLVTQSGMADSVDLSSIPDSVSLSEQAGMDVRSLETARRYVSAFLTAVYVAGFFTLLMLAFLVFLWRESLKSVLKAVGSALAFAGISAAAVSFVARSEAPELLANYVSSAAQGMPGIGAAVSGVATDLISAVFSNVLVISAIVAVAGMLLLVASFFVSVGNNAKKAGAMEKPEMENKVSQKNVQGKEDN